MKDHSGKEVEIDFSWCEENHKLLVAKLCQDCRGILERIKELENGAKKYPARNFDRSLTWQTEPLNAESSGPNGRFEDSAAFQALPEDNSLPHKSDRADLLSSSLDCIMCAWLLRSLQSRWNESNSTIIEQWLRRPASVEPEPFRSPVANRCLSHYRINLRSPAPPHPSDVPFTDNVPSLVFSGSGPLVRRSAPLPKPFKQLRGDELGSLVVDVIPSSKDSHRLLSAMAGLEAETPSSSTWELFKIWLEACDTGHSECHQSSTRDLAQLPKHLIDIQSIDSVRVVETIDLLSKDSSAAPRYATLSHCASGIYEPKLNGLTLNELWNGISAHNLPALFRDTIILVRALNIPYLWIDSYCIHPHSDDNWRLETSNVGQIYLNAYLCISASVAEDISSSILAKRTKDWPQPLVYENLVIQADYSMAAGLQMRQPLWCNRMRTLSDWAIDNAPLNQRAWTMQQRLFSRRTLHCTADEFVWECCRGMTSESHPLITTGGSMLKDAWKQLREPVKLFEDPSVPPTNSKEELKCLERWSQLIHTFSKAGIPNPNDRLSVCHPIAKRLQPTLGGCVAGLWERYMPTQLLWQHDIFCHAKHGDKQTLRPNPNPSWSWAKLDCPSHLPRYYNNNRGDFPSPETRNPDGLVDLSAPVHIKISHIDVQLSSEAGTDAVEQGRLDLIGRLFPIYRSVPFGHWLNNEAPHNSSSDRRSSFVWDDPDAHGFDDDMAIRRQALQPVNDQEQSMLRCSSYEGHQLLYKKLLAIHSPTLTSLCFLPVTERSANRWSKGLSATGEPYRLLSGLVLNHSQEDGEGVYRRVGYFQYAHDEFENAVKCEINENVPLTDQWPSRKSYSSEEGFTISII